MAVETRTTPRPFGAADLDDMPNDGYRREIIDGSLVVTPAPAGGHQWCLIQLGRIMLDASPAECMVMIAPYDWRPPTGESFQPDLMVIQRKDFDFHGPLRATPLLVVEVLSPSNHAQDRAVKRDRYQALGVPAYWIIDPGKPSFTALRLDEDGRYKKSAQAEAGQRLQLDYPFPVEIVPAQLTAV